MVHPYRFSTARLEEFFGDLDKLWVYINLRRVSR
jgi:hypothetical protein